MQKVCDINYMNQTRHRLSRKGQVENLQSQPVSCLIHILTLKMLCVFGICFFSLLSWLRHGYKHSFPELPLFYALSRLLCNFSA